MAPADARVRLSGLPALPRDDGDRERPPPRHVRACRDPRARERASARAAGRGEDSRRAPAGEPPGEGGDAAGGAGPRAAAPSLGRAGRRAHGQPRCRERGGRRRSARVDGARCGKHGHCREPRSGATRPARSGRDARRRARDDAGDDHRGPVINPLPLVLADLRQSAAGAVAIVALVAVAVALGVVTTAEERALRTGTARAADAFDLLVGARGSPTQLVLTAVYLEPTFLDLVPGRALEQIQRESGVDYAAPLVFGDSYQGDPIVGSTVDFVTRGGTREVAEGRVFRAEREVVLGADVSLAVGESFVPDHGRSARSREHPD